MKKYNFITAPLAHQLEVLRKIWNKDYHVLAHDVGTGKTKVMCDMIAWHTAEKGLPVLILCPLSVVYNWKNELEKHARIGETSSVIVGTPKKKQELLDQVISGRKRIAITNYDAIRSMPDLMKMKWSIVVFDELHLLKSPKSDRSKFCVQISKNSFKRFGLTGTMILNSLLDVYNQMLVIDQGLSFGDNFFEFRARYFEDKNKHWAGKPNYFPKWELKKNSEEKMKEKMKELVDVRRKEDCLDLPDVVFETRVCELGTEQRKRYEDIKKELITIISEQGVSVARTALTRDLRLNQVTSGHLTLDDGKVYSFEPSVKLELLRDEIESLIEQGKKIIVWAVFRHDIEMIGKMLQHHKVDHVVVYGDTGREERQTAIDRFQNSAECKVFLGNPASAGTGITLTASDVAIFYSYNYNLGNYLQALGRNHRKGSEIHKSITYIHLVARDTIDEVIVSSLERKEDLAERVINSMKEEKNVI